MSRPVASLQLRAERFARCRIANDTHERIPTDTTAAIATLADLPKLAILEVSC